MRIIHGLLLAACVAGACSKPATKSASASAPATMAQNTPQPGAAPGPQAPLPPAYMPAPLSADKLALALKALNLKPAPLGKVMNDCGEAVTPGVHTAELGGDVGRAYLIVVPGGPNSVTCYGDNPGALYLLRATKEGAFTLIFSDRGFLAVMPDTHKGVHDVAVGGPGFEFPVYEWNGSTFVRSRSIKDSELPETLN